MSDIETTTVEAAGEHQVEAVEPTVLAAVKKVNARRVKTERKPRARKAATSDTPKAARSATAAAAPKIKETTMNFDATNWTNQAFANVPGADNIQTLLAEAGSRGQQALEKSRTVAEELAELTRANVEAVVEAGKIAATGAKSVGEDAMQRARSGLEQNVAEFKSLAQASSPSEFFQLQGEIARSNFDRMVATFSQLTEQSVKLAGEAMQPLSTRAAVNAEKINELTA